MSKLQLDQASESAVRKGSVEYMPYENFRDARITHATDVYALGIVLWELWHNTLFEALYRKELNRQRFDVIDMSAFTPLAMLNFSCPRPYKELVRKCLQPEAQRPSVIQVVRALEEICAV